MCRQIKKIFQLRKIYVRILFIAVRYKKSAENQNLTLVSFTKTIFIKQVGLVCGLAQFFLVAIVFLNYHQAIHLHYLKKLTSDSDSSTPKTFGQVLWKKIPFVLALFFVPITEVRTHKQAIKQTIYVC